MKIGDELNLTCFENTINGYNLDACWRKWYICIIKYTFY